MSEWGDEGMQRLFSGNYDLAGVQAIYSKGELIYHHSKVGTGLRQSAHNSDVQTPSVAQDTEA